MKMDVEGAELDVLAGSHELLARCRPTLAISLYHNWDDLWNIPQALNAKLDLFLLCPAAYAKFLRPGAIRCSKVLT